MGYCTEHFIDYDSLDCPRCLAEDRHEEVVDLAQQAVHQAKHSEHKRANPGDYKCPECLYVTLKRGAMRCPICRARITQQYWAWVEAAETAYVAEQAQAKIAAAEAWARAEPERDRFRVEARQRTRASRFAILYFAYLLPLLSSTVAMALSESYRNFGLQSAYWAIFLPVVNWVGYAALIFGAGPERPLALAALVVLIVAGAGIARAIRHSKRPRR